MATLTNVDNINKYKEDPQLYKGRNTIKRLEFVRNDELTDYYENDEYIVWHETNRNQITVLRKDGMVPESWYDLWNIKNQIWGEEVLAIEIYPKKSELIDGCNQRHLFRLDVKQKIDFGNASKLHM
mgnify:CR=1 FL=1